MNVELLLITVLTLSLPVMAGQRYISGPNQVDLIELFTSEGCSSCPPAEQRMNGYSEDPGLWTDFVPVEFHVDYWNYLGWIDPFSATEFSARQRSYSKEWKASRIFTPCFVVNGKVDSKAWRNTRRNQPGILTVSMIDNKASVSFIPTLPSQQNLTLWIAPLCGEITSSVTAGENRGRKLGHNFIALSLQSQKMESRNGVHSTTLSIPYHPKTKAIAAWVTTDQSLKPIQATGGWVD